MPPPQTALGSNKYTFQILSLDGGGIKGIFSASLLAALEADLNINTVDNFDLIAGTSTGGIIALALGLGLKPREVVDFYVSWGARIFHNSVIDSVSHLIYRKYGSQTLKHALQSCFGDKLFGDSKKRLVIPSYNLDEGDVYIFRTRHHDRLRRDFKVPAWKVGLATSAAPTFFPIFQELDSLRLIDGGVWANNPTMVAIVEAQGTLNIPLENIRVLNIGTTEEVSRRPKWLNSGGILPWAISKAVVDIVMQGQSLAVSNQASFLLGKQNFIRVSPKVPPKEFSLDGISRADQLIAKAAHHSRHFAPIYKEAFAGHIAETFNPLPMQAHAIATTITN